MNRNDFARTTCTLIHTHHKLTKKHLDIGIYDFGWTE